MKILQIASHTAIRRGGAVQAYRLARELVRRGHDVTCVFHAKGGMPTAADALTLKKVEEAGAHLVFFDMESFVSLLAFRRFLRRERFDVIHSHRDLALRFATFGAMGNQPPVFVTNRGTTYLLRPFSLARYLFRRPGLHRVVAVAEAVKDALIESGPLPPEKIDVIYGSVDTEYFDPARIDPATARAAFSIPSGAYVVGTVATYASKKGYDIFFRAAAEVVRKWQKERGEIAASHPPVFLVVGGGVEKKMASLVESLGLRDRVIFAGHCEDIPRALAAMNIFVCASTKGEGLTGTIREAMAMRLPCISSDVSGNREIIYDGRTGLLVEGGDADALASAIQELAADPSLAAKLADAGYHLIQEEFTDTIRGDRIVNLYAAVLASSAKSR